MEAPLALYRRYRPETFSEVIGQDHVTAPLRNALSNNRVNHAYLFSGPRGCGKTTSARILARAINCEKGPIAEPCGVCKSCTDLARGGPGSIDVIEIDAASHGGVDDARDLRERAFFAPVESRYKIYIIDEAHMVTTQGFNALLKLVEEPPPHLKFIFATTEPDKVIGTIRSRTHHYPFRLVPPKVLGDYMASLCESEGVAIEPAALPLVVRAGAGSVRDSLSVLDQLIGGAGPDGVTYELAVALLGFTPDSLLDACVDGFAAHDSKAVFETIEKVIETGQDPKRFAEDLLRRLRDLVVLSAVPNAIHSGLIEAAEDQGERLQTQAAGIGAAELTRAADIVAAGLLEMRGATAPRLQLELICAKVLLPGADDSTNGIQARLDRMERRLTIGVPAGTPEAVQPPAAVGGPEPDAATSRAAARAAAGGSATSTAAAGGSAAGTAPAGAVGGPSASGAVSGPAVGGPPGTSPKSGDSAGPGGPASAGRAGRSAGDGVGSGSPSGGAHPVSSRSGAWGDESASPTPAPSSQPASSQPAGAAPAASAAPGSGSAASAAPGSASARSAEHGSAPASSAGPGAAPGTSAAAASSGGGPGSTATGASGAPSAGAVGLADIRRLWPEVLEAVKAKRRFAWIMLSQNAQVIAVDDQTLTLGLVNAGARESFARSGSDEILRQAMIDTIGLNRRIEAVVDPSTDPGAGGGGGQRPPAAPTSPTTPASGTPAPGGASGPGDAAGPGGAGPGGAAGPGGGGAGGGAGTGGGTGATGGPSSAGATTSGGAAGAVGDPAGAEPATPGGAGGSAGATGAANSQGDATVPSGGPAGTATRGSWRADSPGADPADGPGGDATDSARPSGPHATGSAAGHAGSGGTGGSVAEGATGAGSTAGGPGIGGPSADASAAGGVGVGDSTAGGSAGGSAAGGGTGGGSGGSGAGSSPGGASAGGGPGAVGAMAGGSAGAGSGGPGASGQVVGRGGVAVEEPPDYDVPPEPDPWDDPPPPPSRRPSDAVGGQVGGNRREQAASKRRAAEAAVAAEQARRAAQGPAAPEVPLTPEEEADAIGEDDLVLEDDSQSHTDLLRETLGAQIITEEPN